MGNRPRIKDVARRAGVSEKTVSNVINDHPNVSARTRSAVEEAIAELGYRVNLAGRHLRRGESGVIALIVPELDLGYFAELSDLVIREAGLHSRTVLVHQTGALREREMAALDGFGTDFVDGVLFSPLAMGDDDRPVAEAGNVDHSQRARPGDVSARAACDAKMRRDNVLD